jgi:2-desacetyl-2-hydroxyethyl bacteriochlorophyllide A dehydrogenase
MKTKAIVFTRRAHAEWIDADLSALGANDVMVRLEVSTISSGTERANFLDDGLLSVEKGAVAGANNYPKRLGYSCSGIVTEIGEKVTRVKVGDRVACWWTTHSEYNCIPETKVLKLEDNVSFAEAALWHIATFPLAAIRKTKLELGESAIVMGMGILGLMAIRLLSAAGAAPIIAVDPVEEKRALALSMGADYAFDPFAEDFEEKVRAVTGGGAKVAIEVTGNGKALDQVLDCMAKFGRVALLGCTRHSDFSINYYSKVHGPGISLIGAHTMARPHEESYPGYFTTYDDMAAIQRLVAAGRLSFMPLVAETHSPAECTEVYDRLGREKAFPVVQFDYNLAREEK